MLLPKHLHSKAKIEKKRLQHEKQTDNFAIFSGIRLFYMSVFVAHVFVINVASDGRTWVFSVYVGFPILSQFAVFAFYSVIYVPFFVCI